MFPGEVSEWLIELVSKTSVLYWSTAGSNPALSVMPGRGAASSLVLGACSVSAGVPVHPVSGLFLSTQKPIGMMEVAIPIALFLYEDG